MEVKDIFSFFDDTLLPEQGAEFPDLQEETGGMPVFTVELVIFYERENPVWSGQYRIGHGIAVKNGGHVLQLHHEAPPAGAPDPVETYQKKRRAILARVPKCRRLPAGALFTERIVSADGGLNVDLRHSGALKRIAAVFLRRFPDETELLAALTYFVHQNLTYSARAACISSQLAPLEKLRVGATICSGFSLVLKGLLESLTDPRTGTPYRAAYQNTGQHHVVLAVCLGRKQVLLDPSLGVVYFDRSGRKLASVAAIVKDRELATRAMLGRDDFADPDAMYQLHYGPSELQPSGHFGPSAEP